MSAWAELTSAAQLWAATRGSGDESCPKQVRQLAGEAGLRGVVLVEGVSDAEAVVAATRRRQRDFLQEGICVVPMGGATNIRRFLALFGPAGLAVPVAGLYDVAEEHFFSRAVADAAVLNVPSRTGLASLGFFACVLDLEDELIRAVGVDGVEEVIRGRGEGRQLDTFRRQPAQRDRATEQQLRRFLGTTSGRKTRYARALIEWLDPAALPPPLQRLLDVSG